jgi:hypothetical protein
MTEPAENGVRFRAAAARGGVTPGGAALLSRGGYTFVFEAGVCAGALGFGAGVWGGALGCGAGTTGAPGGGSFIPRSAKNCAMFSIELYVFPV